MIINVTYDTVSKTLSVTEDGTEVGDVSSIAFYNRYNSGPETLYSMDMCQCIESEEDGVVKTYRASANEDGTLNKVSETDKIKAIAQILKAKK